MYCAKFQKQISSFINNNLDINEMDMFINHARKCRDCYEELEINYMVNIGLEKIEKDESASFDLKGELEKMVDYYENKSDLFYKYNMYKSIIMGVTYVCLCIVIVMYIANIFM